MCRRHIQFEPPYRVKVAAGSQTHLARILRRRGPRFGVSRQLELRRHHPDNGEVALGERQCLCDNVWVATEAPLPEAVAQHHDVATGREFIRREGAAQQWQHPESGKKLIRHPRCGDQFRLFAVEQCQGPAGIGRQIRERLALALQVKEVGRRYGGNNFSSLAVLVLNDDQPLRQGVWQRPQQHRVHQTKDGGVYSHAERESNHCDRGESGLLYQAPDTVANVFD